MSDLGLIRYLGYAALPEAAALKGRLRAEQPAALDNGVHLIVVQSSDGSFVVGDSHHYGETPDPFAPARSTSSFSTNSMRCWMSASGLSPNAGPEPMPRRATG